MTRMMILRKGPSSNKKSKGIFLLQKSFSTSNRLPQEPVRSSFCESGEGVKEAYSDLIDSSKKTLDSILKLQEALVEKNPAIMEANDAALLPPNISEQVASYMRDPSRMVKGMQQRRSVVPVFGKNACLFPVSNSIKDDGGTVNQKSTRKTVKNKQARTRESEKFKKKPKDQSRSQKSQASIKIGEQGQEIPRTLLSALSKRPHISIQGRDLEFF
ncbi:AATF-like protein isoform X2 [Tanacetum coccineum]